MLRQQYKAHVSSIRIQSEKLKQKVITLFNIIYPISSFNMWLLLFGLLEFSALFYDAKSK